jgi:hypothetical protein
MGELTNFRKKAFGKLISVTESLEFKNLRREIINESLYQQSYLKAEKFRRLVEEYDLSLVWMSEYTHYLANGWLTPCFYYKDDQGSIELGAPTKEIVSEKFLEDCFFHPYQILQAANCAKQSRLIRSMLMICWRGIKNRREHLTATLRMDKHPYGSFDPLWIKALTELGMVLEPIYRPQIKGRVTLHNRFDFEEYDKEVDELREKVLILTKDFEKEDWKQIHDATSFFSNSLDKNAELKTLITLMRNEDQDRIKGKIGAALVAREIAHSIRYLALDNKTELSEEQFSEHSGYTRAYFSHFRGSRTIVDGARENRLKFVRGFGLDFSVRARLYVEGDTEQSCFDSALRQYGFVEVINLRGAFSEKKGRGLAFRESLRNDKRSHIYSILVLDGDRKDNIRVVKKAAENAEFLGEFFINDPDFEFQNFSIDELCEIISERLGVNLEPSPYRDAKSKKELFLKIGSSHPELDRVCKGSDWGLLLGKYAEIHPRTDPPGLPEDRPINQIVRLCLFTGLMNFANDENDKKVDVRSGRLVDKIAQSYGENG